MTTIDLTQREMASDKPENNPQQGQPRGHNAQESTGGKEHIGENSMDNLNFIENKFGLNPL